MTQRPPRERILVVDDDKAFRIATQALLEDDAYQVTLARNGAEALAALEEQEFDLVLSDLVMASMSGTELLRQVTARRPELPVIMVTGFGSIPTAVEAMRLGAADYLAKPANNDELLIKIRRALNLRRKEREIRHLREELGTTYSWSNMVGRSKQIQEVIQAIQRVADSDLTVLIQGESGTGKELVARALHYNSIRKEAPFVAVNCSAIPENLLESELFGHEKGAFTGAVRQRIGRFEEAAGGTLFMDEIGDMSAGVQTKLLRVLQEKTLERVGGNKAITVDTRVVAATNRNLELMVRQGDFRQDLYYRLNVFPILLPTLRERPEDIPLLAEHVLAQHAALGGGRVRAIAPQVISAMMRYPWRGNIRELENVIKRAIINCPGETITEVDLPEQEGPDETSGRPLPEESTPFKEYLSAITRDAEERYLRRMLRLSHGNINRVAKLMELDRKTVYRKMADYGIKPEEFRT